MGKKKFSKSLFIRNITDINIIIKIYKNWKFYLYSTFELSTDAANA